LRHRFVTPDEEIGNSCLERGSHDDLKNESEDDEFPGEITQEGNDIQVMRKQRRERATAHRENKEVDTFDYNECKPPKGKSIVHRWIATKEISLHIIKY